MIRAKLVLLGALGVLMGCTAPVGTRGVSVPPDSASQCTAHCESIGLRLSAVAIMANNVGCICEAAAPTAPTAPTAPAGSEQKTSASHGGITGGVAAVVMAELINQQNQAMQAHR